MRVRCLPSCAGPPRDIPRSGVVDALGVIRHQKRREYPPARPLSTWAIALGAVIVLAIAVAAWIVLLRRYGGTGASVELDAIRTAGVLVVGAGGAFALLLAARRQRSTELTLVHTEHDVTERRITELYTKAADQLGSDQAPVRLAGLYALERLAHSTVEHRQTIVDVICAYLRMPYTPPLEVGEAVGNRDEQSRQERQVRLTAQGILARNLRVSDEGRRRWWAPWRVYREPSWPGIRLDLNGALLLDISLIACRIAEADFTGTRFTGRADFRGTQFTGTAFFEDAWFTGTAFFEDAWFTSGAFFRGAQFTGTAFFDRARFTDLAVFVRARFTGGADFSGVRFTGGAIFDGARFTGGALFDDTQYTGTADFTGAYTSGPGRETVWPPGWTTRHAQPDNGEDPAFRYLVRREE